MTDEISEVVSSFRPNLNLIVGDEDLGGVCPDGQHGQNRQRDERTQPCRYDFPRGEQLEGARNCEPTLLHIASDRIRLKLNCSISSNSIKLEPHYYTGDKEDQPTAGWVWRCWRLPPTCRPPPPAWIQGCQLDRQRLSSEQTNQHHTNQHQNRHQEQPPFPAWLKVNNQLIEKDWSPSSTSTPHWSTLTSTTKRNLCLSNIWSQVSEGFDGQTRTELLEAGNELDRVRILKTISCQSFTTCSTSPQLWEQQIPIYVDTHYLWKQKIPKYVDTD